MKTLQQILEIENARRNENGAYGIEECKKSIRSALELDAKYNIQSSLYTYLEQYVKRANDDIFFNKAMVLACWELINNK